MRLTALAAGTPEALDVEDFEASPHKSKVGLWRVDVDVQDPTEKAERLRQEAEAAKMRGMVPGEDFCRIELGGGRSRGSGAAPACGEASLAERCAGL